MLTLLACAGGPEEDPASAPAAKPSEAHWGYEEANGPARWGELSTEWTTCGTGRHQSPIDLGSATTGDVSATTMKFPPAKLSIVHQEHVLEALDNGHTIQVNYDGGETLSVGDETYRLLQYHFHSPSEHTVEGKHFPMEMHLVHKSTAGDLAVIGVFLEEGEHNPAFDALWRNLPDRKGERVDLRETDSDIDALLPETRSSYRYDGSLTTPPCSEGVRWIVMTEPVQLGSDQISAFRKVFYGNNRPTQPLNERRVATDRVGGS